MHTTNDFFFFKAWLNLNPVCETGPLSHNVLKLMNYMQY